MKIKVNKKYIIMAVIILLIIIGIVVLNTTGALKKIGKSAEQISEEEARVKLEQVLQNASTQKESDVNYNSTEYLTSLLQGQNIIVNENIVSIDGYSFEIDRENLEVTQSLGKSQVIVSSKVLKQLGKSAEGKYRAKVQITVTSNIPIDNIIFENENGTFAKVKTTELTYIKEMEIELDKEYVVTVATKDGKINNKTYMNKYIPPPPVKVGQYVDYPVDIDGNTSDFDWQIFYKEEDPSSPNYGATYIIPDYYVPYSKMTTSISNAGMRLYSGTYRVRWESLPSYQTITDNIKQIFMYDYTGTSYESVKCVSSLLNPDNWKNDFVTSKLQVKGGMAIGGSTINMWCASWNKEYPTQKITPTISGTGYRVNGANWIRIDSYIGYTSAPNIYYPTKSKDSDGTESYWIASPSSNADCSIMEVMYNSGIAYRIIDGPLTGLRPLVYLPPNVTIEPSETPNLWNIDYGD